MTEKSEPVQEFSGVTAKRSATALPEASGDEETRPGSGQEGGPATVRPEVASDNQFGGEEDYEGVEYAAVARLARYSTSTRNSAVSGTIFRRWISTLVSHFTAKRILEKEAMQFPHVIVKFHLMAWSRTKEKSSSWEDMKGYIRKALMCTGPFPSQARSLAELSIKKLDEVINHQNMQAFVPIATPQVRKRNGLLDRAAEPMQSLKLRGCQHGEALLATLMRIRGDESEVRKVTQDRRLMDLIAVFFLLVVYFLGLTGGTGHELGKYWNIKALLPSLLGPIEGVKVWTRQFPIF